MRTPSLVKGIPDLAGCSGLRMPMKFRLKHGLSCDTGVGHTGIVISLIYPNHVLLNYKVSS